MPEISRRAHAVTSAEPQYASTKSEFIEHVILITLRAGYPRADYDGVVYPQQFSLAHMRCDF